MVSWINKLYRSFKFYFYNSFITNFPSYTIRTVYLKNVLKIDIGRKTAIHMGCFFAGSFIKIGSHCVVARKCYLDGRAGQITIGNNVSIAPEVCIYSMSHDINSRVFGVIVKPVMIEDFVWIASRVMIMPGVTAGKGCVMAAGSVVSKDVEEFSVVAGNPAKKIAERTKDLDYSLEYFPFFNSDIQ